MDFASGLFALGGLALGGALSELRAWREARARRDDALTDLRRRTYATAIRQLETVASRCARWLEASDKTTAAEAFWEGLTDAYAALNELRLVVVDMQTAEEYMDLLGIYRAVVEKGGTELPKSGIARGRLVDLFRKDLGVG